MTLILHFLTSLPLKRTLILAKSLTSDPYNRGFLKRRKSVLKLFHASYLFTMHHHGLEPWKAVFFFVGVLWGRTLLNHTQSGAPHQTQSQRLWIQVCWLKIARIKNLADVVIKFQALFDQGNFYKYANLISHPQTLAFLGLHIEAAGNMKVASRP